MQTLPELQFPKFQEALTPQRIRTFQIISSALVAGATIFFGIILFLYFSSSETSAVASETEVDSILPILSIVHVAEGGICYLAAFFVYRYFTSLKGLAAVQKNAKRQAGINSELSAEGYFAGAIFTAYIIRAALLEGVALFGLIICLLGIQNGSIQNAPVYWLNLLSYIIFMGVLLATFPTKQRLEDIFTRRFQSTVFQLD